jgi:hypothetical protein
MPGYATGCSLRRGFDVRAVRDPHAIPRNCDFERWEKTQAEKGVKVEGAPITRYWLVPAERRPKDVYAPSHH